MVVDYADKFSGFNIKGSKMNKFQSITRPLKWFSGLLLVALVAGCGGGGGGAPILGGGGAPAPLTAATYVNLIKPRVTVTIPATTIPGPTLIGAPANAAITATFTKDMAPASITAASFTVTDAGGVTVPGVNTVSYDVASRTAIFTHGTALLVGPTYTATITTAATDLVGNPLAGNQAALPAASNYVWTFTVSASDLIAPTVILENPANAATGVAINSTVNATFSKDMNPATICGAASLTATCPVATFTVVNTTAGGTAVAGAVSYVAGSRIATFTPTATLPANSLFTATITAGAKDLAGNALVAGAVPNPWTFTTGTGLAPGAINLGSASTFGIMATAAVTAATASVINGDVSLEPGTSMTGFPPAVVNGSIHINDTVSHQARADLLTAYNSAKGLPPGTTITGGADLGALYPLGMPPGTYTSGSTMLVSTPLTLDAGGNTNAVWVFQIGSSLTTGANVVLANGAQAKNVFWVPTSDVTVGSGTIFYGTIVAGRDATSAGNATLNGRILAGAITAGTVALNGPASTVNVPAP